MKETWQSGQPSLLSCTPLYLQNHVFPFEMQMGIADAILDLVSSGITLKENNLKEIEGGVVLESQVNFFIGFCPLVL